MVLLTVIRLALAFFDPVLSKDIASIIEDDFDNIIGEGTPLQEWVLLFEYFEGWKLPRFHLK